tara:strand:- start:232 stop:405 length:174 start_codon:yes stop_codon:yes gene_type:complete
MNGFKTIQNGVMAYDPEKDGVWLHDGSDPVAFFPRNIIIGMIGHLPASPPHEKEDLK